MEQKKEKGLRIRSCLTGAIWLALVFSTVISALLFAFLNHFFHPCKIFFVQQTVRYSKNGLSKKLTSKSTVF